MNPDNPLSETKQLATPPIPPIVVKPVNNDQKQTSGNMKFSMGDYTSPHHIGRSPTKSRVRTRTNLMASLSSLSVQPGKPVASKALPPTYSLLSASGRTASNSASIHTSVRGSLTPPVQMYHKRQSPALMGKKIQRGRARSVSFSDQCKPVVATDAHRSDIPKRKAGSPNTPDGMIGLTPLMHSARSGEANKVRTLLSQGANAELTDTRGYDALMYAVRDGHAETAQVLLEEGKVSPEGYRVEHPNLSHMMYAALNGHDECIRVLSANNSGLADPDRSGFTPLMAAAQNGHHSAIQALVECADEKTKEGKGENECRTERKARISKCLNVDAQDHNGMTAVAYAAYHGSVAAVKVLVELGMADVCIVAKNGQSPLLWTVVRGHSEVGQLLLHYGAKICDAVRIHIIREHFQNRSSSTSDEADDSDSHDGDRRLEKRRRSGSQAMNSAVLLGVEKTQKTQ